MYVVDVGQFSSQLSLPRRWKTGLQSLRRVGQGGFSTWGGIVDVDKACVARQGAWVLAPVPPSHAVQCVKRECWSLPALGFYD